MSVIEGKSYITTRKKMDYRRIWKEKKKKYVVKFYDRREEGNKKRKM